MPEFSKDKQPARRGDQAKAGAGNKKRGVMTEALMIALKRESALLDENGKPRKRLHVVAEQLAVKAEEGDLQAIKEIFDRTEGKAAQAIVHSGDIDDPVQIILKQYSHAKD